MPRLLCEKPEETTIGEANRQGVILLIKQNANMALKIAAEAFERKERPDGLSLLIQNVSPGLCFE